MCSVNNGEYLIGLLLFPLGRRQLE